MLLEKSKSFLVRLDNSDPVPKEVKGLVQSFKASVRAWKQVDLTTEDTSEEEEETKHESKSRAREKERERERAHALVMQKHELEIARLGRKRGAEGVSSPPKRFKAEQKTDLELLERGQEMTLRAQQPLFQLFRAVNSHSSLPSPSCVSPPPPEFAAAMAQVPLDFQLSWQDFSSLDAVDFAQLGAKVKFSTRIKLQNLLRQANK